MSVESNIEIVENYKMNPHGKVIFQAFTGSGLVASIVAHHLIEEFKMKEMGYISSFLIPSVGIVRNGVIQRPVRIFENRDYILVISEIGIPQDNLIDFIEGMFEWYSSLDPTSIIVLGALPTGRASDAQKLRYSIVASDSLTANTLKDKGLKTMPQGAVYGSVALSLMESSRYGISSFAVLSHCIATIPDYLAAKNVTQLLSQILSLNISIDPLAKNAEELREHLINKEKNKPKGDNKTSFNFDNFDYFDDEFEDDESDEYDKYV